MNICIEFIRHADFSAENIQELTIEDGMLYFWFYKDGVEVRKAFKMSGIHRISMQ